MDVHLRELFGSFQQQFGVGPGLGPGSGTSLLKIDGVSTAFVKAVFRAAAALYRSNPWKRIKPSHLFGVRVGKDPEWSSGRQPFSVLQVVGGGGSGDLGLNLLRGIRRDGDKKSIPEAGLLRITFGPEADLAPANKKMIKNLGLEISGQNAFPVIDVVYNAGDGDPSFRNPSFEELRWLYACMRAFVQVHPLLQQKENAAIAGLFEDFVQNVDVQWPADDPRAWEITSVRVTLPPPRDDHSEQLGSIPKLSELSDDPSEFNEWSVPRQCVVCEKEVPADKAPRCSRCKAVIYCSHSCQKNHWKEAHKGSCELYKSMMDRDEELEIKGFLFPCFVDHACKWLESMGLHGKGMWRRMCGCFKNCTFGLLPPPEGGSLAGAWGVEHTKYPADVPLVDFITGAEISSMMVLSGWAEYYDLRALPPESPVAAMLSFPLSLYHIITALNVTTKNILSKNREVVVHYLGPEGELDWMPAFAEIGHLLGNSGSLHIIMVGPEVSSSLSGGATLLGRRVRVTFLQGLYQEEAGTLPFPHVVVALNAGLESYNSWMAALEVIKAQSVPAFFTDYAEPCCLNAKQVLRAAGLHISYPVTPNPFRSPVRNQMPSTNVPWFSNGFVFGVNT
ncbi:hypothetical protein O6H91_02G025100 [Diphasiastrum complanatum]|uniref:Uncharacterized protein n=1 Tax=Diphasiastrum complanatum TaxID=34168 RepID=A0ACC2EE11_DIPCM|nr:hypothetical protein O6H91_Y395400 [Diphasiastrum complanatum]KAJ7271445.1 hypothetical protein O6H91_Y395400 [Diphasiastrum complanatum]KAJ7271446.1 hypothetical protein O6H91_Y395400 [Diphasiastrum complanatum]KAJ7271447.1 hypothetical protein O6H91_Y395400 [Diphasiastrum complanatum]KAJ7564605.1 hypothetical protein O6H91_02G025100 [Diphasiastrum complanatum]